MKQNPWGYTVEKLTNTLECLATHLGDARQRLLVAYPCFMTLRTHDFPPEYKEEWDWVWAELTKFGPIIDHKGNVSRGSVENTMHRARNSTASKIAKKIYELYWAVSENQQYR